jgi:hypothetical protein
VLFLMVALLALLVGAVLIACSCRSTGGLCSRSGALGAAPVDRDCPAGDTLLIGLGLRSCSARVWNIAEGQYTMVPRRYCVLTLPVSHRRHSLP